MCGDREFAESTVNKGKIEEPSKGTSKSPAFETPGWTGIVFGPTF